MKLQKFIYGLLLASLFIACGSSKTSEGKKSTTLIDTLTDFSIAINANDFDKAVNFLDESEKVELLDYSGKVHEESQKRLKALRLQVLIKNPRIQLSGNKLVGILSALPQLKHVGPEAMTPEESNTSEPATEMESEEGSSDESPMEDSQDAGSSDDSEGADY